MRELAKKLKDKKYGPFIGVPCSRLKEFIEEANNVMIVTSEHEAIMIAAGLATGGYKPVVFLQNSGIGDLIDPLTSFLLVAGVELGAIVISWRGQNSDAAHHLIMGKLMNKILKEIPIEKVGELYVV